MGTLINYSRLKLMHGAMSFINHQVEAGHRKLICYVHPSSMFEVLCHAKFNMPYGTELAMIDPDPVGFDRIKNNRGLAIHPDLCFDMDPTEFNDTYYDANPKENILFDGVVINGAFPTAVSDVVSMWDHVKPGGKLVLVGHPVVIGALDYSGFSKDDQEVIELMLDFYYEQEAIDHTMPETWYDPTGVVGEPFVLQFTNKPSYTEIFGAPVPEADRKRNPIRVK